MITEQEFLRISGFIKSRYGIDLSRKKGIIDGRLENYVRNAGFGDYASYMDAIEKDITGNLEKDLVNLLTTNHTYFMREAEHFEYLKNVVLPELRQKEQRNRDLCIWCAASSTGEEPYTLAMILKDFFGLEHDMWNTQVLATDVSTGALSQAMQGIYRKDQIEVLPEQWQRRFFKQILTKDEYRVTEELKKEVLFRKFNLMEPFPFKRRMHVIFLRNVMIYFNDKTKRELIQKIYDVTESGGYLFIGQTETFDRSEVGFRMVSQSVFRKES